ncbi:MAG: AAA family ATPase, partial [Spirochaetes bacterium]|nr:AAA family ATPase [Spirochaetota bacterium]
MRPSQNAFFGYSYQQCITFLMLAKMDVEREIEVIEIEATVNNNFDDIKLSLGNTQVYCQIKDKDNISYNDLKIKDNQIIIKGEGQELSNGINLLFLKNIDITCNTQFLGFSACKMSNVYIIPLSREKAGTIVSDFYKYNEKRESHIVQFFNVCLDKRRLNIKREILPSIDIYDIHLLEKTINVGKNFLEFENILYIEGKPGVGKSHLVTCLAKEYQNSLVYRFWVSNQDKDYKARLIYQNFLTDISKELFQDYRYRTEDEIIDYLSKNRKAVIIDGLDHVENYQNDELVSFSKFINKLKDKCKTIVLSRPLKMKIDWTKQHLANWNFEETKTVLEELYLISDYKTCRDIYELTDGYPILVRFVTEHFKQYNEMPLSGKLNGIDDYYEGIISNTNILVALTLFLSTRSFIMKSEISLFLKDELSEIVMEFIESHPY